MKALCWEGVNKLAVEQVPDPELRNEQDVIVRLVAGTACGSDLHLIGGYIPFMRAGDVIGHVEVRLRRQDRDEGATNHPDTDRHRTGTGRGTAHGYRS